MLERPDLVKHSGPVRGCREYEEARLQAEDERDQRVQTQRPTGVGPRTCGEARLHESVAVIDRSVVELDGPVWRGCLPKGIERCRVLGHHEDRQMRVEVVLVDEAVDSVDERRDTNAARLLYLVAPPKMDRHHVCRSAMLAEDACIPALDSLKHGGGQRLEQQLEPSSMPFRDRLARVRVGPTAVASKQVVSFRVQSRLVIRHPMPRRAVEERLVYG
mmetsp:Transcript_39866/g.66146  ORF Transcript_39866/g.66146 Transcript_39866/m.66146 type:complete len:217 (-) Transcript_39866:254-904(-)